ncbi:MAG: copper resistance protein CopC [Acidimicrobiales bacterium]
MSSSAAPPTTAARLARAAVVLAGVLAALVALAGPAAAHAVVVASSPGDRERLTTPPKDVRITFSEDVTTVGKGLQVVGRDGNAVDDGSPTQPDGKTLAVGLPADLRDGTYTASYRVISADGHPVSGAIVFAVGEGASFDATAPATGDPLWETVGAVFRFITYTAALLAAGAAFFLAFLDDEGPEDRALFRLVRWSTPVAALGAAGMVVTQAALATGQGLGALGDLSLVRQALVNGLGWNVVVLLVGLAALLVALEVRGIAAQVLVFYGAITTCASFAFWGHAAEGPNRWLALSADALHVIVAAIWFGGLVALAITLRARVRAAAADDEAGGTVPSTTEADDTATAAATAGSGATATAVLERPTDAAGGPDDEGGSLDADADGDAPDPYETGRIVARFSTTAAISVALLTVAGVALAWTQLGGLNNLLTTTYGRLLLAKVLVAAAVGVVALYNNVRLLPSLGDEEEDFVQGELGNAPAAPRPRWDRLVRTARLEAIGLVVVLAITAVLVNVTPGRSGQATAGPFNQTQTIDGGNRLNIVVSPALVGTNNIHLTYSTPTGTPMQVQKADLEMSLPERGIGPITKATQAAGPGHFILDGTPDLAVAGTWTITVKTRISDFTADSTSFQVPITTP